MDEETKAFVEALKRLAERKEGTEKEHLLDMAKNIESGNMQVLKFKDVELAKETTFISVPNETVH